MAPAVVMPCDNQREIPEPLVISSSTESLGSFFTDTFVQKYCWLHVRGNFIVLSQANTKQGARNVRKIQRPMPARCAATDPKIRMNVHTAAPATAPSTASSTPNHRNWR
jgi:hypothetical protein